MRELKVPFHTRKRLRQKHAWSLFKVLYTWLKQNSNAVPPKSALGIAIRYMLNQWHYLIAYLRHGCVEIDTNWLENLIRPTALGKKIGYSWEMKKVIKFMHFGLVLLFLLL